MTTTDDLMTLANDYANAETVFEAAQKQQALRLAVEQLVAHRDAMRAALTHAFPVLDMYQAYGWADRNGVISAVRAALKGKT